MGTEYSHVPTMEPAVATNVSQNHTPPKQKTFEDPRSPTLQVDRTPLKERNDPVSCNTPKNNGPVFKQTQFDPRSPSTALPRTPVNPDQNKRPTLTRTPLSYSRMKDQKRSH
uniref:Uncharacterized protein 3 n=1 Tax=Halisarca dujardinii TaxID=2583056 RepID=A0AA96MNS7_HALDU|nr:uncharacterized protein 3 [Halisarca dujardinii]